MTDSERIGELIVKCLKGQLSLAEETELNEWINLSKENQEIFARNTNKERLHDEVTWAYSAQERNLEKLKNELLTGGKVVPMKWYRIAAAACILALIGTGLWYWLAPGQQKNVIVKSTVAPAVLVNDVAPGGNKAVLLLDNGQTIVLDSAKNGTLAFEGKTKIVKQADGKIIYAADETKNSEEVHYNILTTPRTGMYTVTLPDNSIVYLNSISSLKYPTSFIGNERKVELTGEAFFDVAHNATKPFKVIVHRESENESTEIKVLGTRFNVFGYSEEEAIKTTLVEGSVKVTKGNATDILKPGQQAQITNSIRVSNVNTDLETAWVNGYFRFQETDLKTVMRQLARWYDIEVVYPDNMPNILFNGRVPRNVNISEVLKVLIDLGAHLKIEGKKVIVMP